MLLRGDIDFPVSSSAVVRVYPWRNNRVDRLMECVSFCACDDVDFRFIHSFLTWRLLYRRHLSYEANNESVVRRRTFYADRSVLL